MIRIAIDLSKRKGLQAHDAAMQIFQNAEKGKGRVTHSCRVTFDIESLTNKTYDGSIILTRPGNEHPVKLHFI